MKWKNQNNNTKGADAPFDIYNNMK